MKAKRITLIFITLGLFSQAEVPASSAEPAVLHLTWQTPLAWSFPRQPILLDEGLLIQRTLGGLALIAPSDGAIIRDSAVPEGSLFSSPVVVDDVAYVTCLDSEVFALQVESGSVVWASILPDRTHLSDLTGRGGRVQHQLSDPVTDGQRIYFASTSGSVFAVDCADGAVLWRVTYSDQYQGAHAVIDRGTVYAVTWQGLVLALRATDGSKLWELTLSKALCPPQIKDGLMFVADTSGELHAVDLTRRRIRWSNKVGVKFRGPLSIEGRMVVLGDESGVHGVDARTGELKWSFEAYSETPVIAGDFVFCPTREGRLLVLDSFRGSLIEEHLAAPCHPNVSPLFAGGRLFVSGGSEKDNGQLYCFRVEAMR